MVDSYYTLPVNLVGILCKDAICVVGFHFDNAFGERYLTDEEMLEAAEQRAVELE